MSTPTNPGTDPVQSQIPVTEPTAPQQPQSPAQTPSEPQAPTTPPQPSAEDLQRQIAELNQKYQTATESARYFQSQFDKQRQSLTQAIVGAQPQEDPAAPYVQNYLKAGYGKEDAELLGRGAYASLAPLIQQNQQLQAAIHGSTLVGDVMQDAYSKVPQALSDPEIFNSVKSVLTNEALAGRKIDPEYALDLVGVAMFRKQLAVRQAAPQQQQTAPQVFGQFGWAGHGGPPQTQQQTAPQPLSPQLQAEDAKVKARYAKQA